MGLTSCEWWRVAQPPLAHYPPSMMQVVALGSATVDPHEFYPVFSEPPSSHASGSTSVCLPSLRLDVRLWAYARLTTRSSGRSRSSSSCSGNSQNNLLQGQHVYR
eukprot:GHVU01219447.1.p1 GENE.GHVU01219447.1~~GHVU01219447.1.p1  ORF type:complete len:105 (-),score=6.68 GHVU01219447.1:1014-1328(-)